MDQVTFCEQLWEIVEPFLTVKDKPAVANSIADLLGDFEIDEEAVLATDWYANYANQPIDDEEEEE